MDTRFGSVSGCAAIADANTTVASSTGAKSFPLDHPLYPANRYLNHYCAEGPDQLMIYRGKVMLDSNSEARFHLPDYFESANCDYHFQITCVGRFAPA